MHDAPLRHLRILAAAFLCAAASLATLRAADPDFGDHRSETLTARAWKASLEGNAELTLAYADKCITMYEAEAVKMQQGLKEYPPANPREETFKYWALNDVGTCLFIKGQTLLKRGDKKGAREAFGRLVKDFKFAQCWDAKGWFWKPAEAAKQKLVELEFDEK